MGRGKHLEPKAAVKRGADPGWSFNIQHSVQIKQSLDGAQSHPAVGIPGKGSPSEATNSWENGPSDTS